MCGHNLNVKNHKPGNTVDKAVFDLARDALLHFAVNAINVMWPRASQTSAHVLSDQNDHPLYLAL